MAMMRSILAAGLMASVVVALGCAKEQPPWGTERQLTWPGQRQQVWAVAPVVNLSGQKQVDPLLQADLLFQQLQQVKGITAIPVDRVAAVYAALRIEQVQSEAQAAQVCQLLGCDGLLVATVTAYDPYNPPKMGLALQLFDRSSHAGRAVDVRELAHAGSATAPADALPTGGAFVQVVGMYDATAGSTRDALFAYAAGRHDPSGPYSAQEYLVSMDRYSSFVYYAAVAELLNSPQLGR